MKRQKLGSGANGEFRARQLAARAMLSPFHFNRLVRAGIGETAAFGI